MKVLNARVRWMQGYANSPTLEILVDRMPEREALRYEQRETIYYAEHEGYVSFFAYASPGEGFGGSHFPITMKDGSKVTLKGPWSSRAGAVNAAGFGPCVDVSITQDPRAFQRGHTFYAGHVTFKVAYEASLIAGCHLVQVEDRGDVRWDPSIDPNRVVKMPAEERDRTETQYPESMR